MTKEIKLTNSDLVALVDDEDYEFLSQFSWHLEPHGYISAKIRMHTMVKAINGEKREKGQVIDHVNRLKNDNQDANLRITSGKKNSRNTGPHSNSLTGFKNVSLTKDGKFSVAMLIGKKSIVAGLFDDVAVAAKGADQLNRHYFGESAYLNFPDENLIVFDIEEIDKKINKPKKERDSKYVGVYRASRGDKYFVRFEKDGKQIYSFYDKDDYKVALAREKYIISENLEYEKNFPGLEEMVMKSDTEKSEQTGGKYSKYYGIGFYIKLNKWCARVPGKYLGIFDTEKDAVDYRNKYIDDNGLKHKKNIFKD